MPPPTESVRPAGGRPPVPRPGPIGPLWVRLRTACARDATRSLLTGSTLVVSPHPDDETIACGLLLAATSARGGSVTVVVATDGGLGWFGDGTAPLPAALAAVRSTEWHAALDALGVQAGARHELAYPDGDLAAHEEEVSADIAALMSAVSPSRVVLPSPDDLHPDHRALARATLRAVASLDPGVTAPALVTYRVYPEAGLWPAGDDRGASPTRAAWQLVRSLPGLVWDRDDALHAPTAVAAKRRAVDAYVSQRPLLGSGVRSVWGTGIELFRTLPDPTT